MLRKLLPVKGMVPEVGNRVRVAVDTLPSEPITVPTLVLLPATLAVPEAAL